LGGAHWDHDQAAEMIKDQVKKAISALKGIDPEKRIDDRIEKFARMGRWEETSAAQQ
jgi:acetyl-CoA carboxylase carboxyl transferase subunit alpha